MRIGKRSMGILGRSSVRGFILCAGAVLLLTGCDLAANYQKPDRGSNMEIQDFRDGLTERLPDPGDAESKGTQSTIPALQPYVTTNAQGLKPMPLVSVSVNQSVPVRDILFELAEQADYDLELDPNIKGSVIFTARNRPFDEVIERLSDIAGLRYKFKGEHLRVEVDTPYNKTYKLDYLSYLRRNKSTVTTNVSVVSGDGAESGSGFNTSSESVADFWAELELNLNQFLGGASTGGLKTKYDPRITAVEQNPDVQAVAPAQGGEGGQVQVQPPEAVLRVESLPVDDGSSGSNGNGEEEGPVSSFALNKQAGIINVFATEKQHKDVAEYLRLLKKSVTSQVLIEAKIFEVDLNDEYITGIDWGVLGLSGGEGSFAFMNESGRTNINNLLSSGAGFFSPAVGSTMGVESNFTVGFVGNDVQALLQAISGFGTVRALASPRLTVLNNQSGVLNVATNRVFFKLDIDSNTTDNVVTVDVDSEARTVPEGVLVNVLPSIDLDGGTVSLALRPTVTRVVDTVNDPAVGFVAASISGAENVVSEIPEINVQEIDTVVKVRSGQPIVMGGLLQDRSDNLEESVPVLGETPIVGSLFRKKKDLVKKSELVIFLKATILQTPEDSIHDTDRDLYKAFSGDRRPLKL
ncbi:MAG: type II and III secretion system family protein [Alphaproteobacteria bacterium]|nr:type II and III secretion system family protein [Alphaproteobacteria bacterium]MCB9974851.1 type II and III secretion system family protein [Rhodospirillales bacterium]